MIDMRWNVNKLIQLKDNLSYRQCRDAHFHPLQLNLAQNKISDQQHINPTLQPTLIRNI